MSLQTIIKLLGWLAKKLTTEQARLDAQSSVLTKQIIAMEKEQARVRKDSEIAMRMSTAVNELIK